MNEASGRRVEVREDALAAQREGLEARARDTGTIAGQPEGTTPPRRT